MEAWKEKLSSLPSAYTLGDLIDFSNLVWRKVDWNWNSGLVQENVEIDQEGNLSLNVDGCVGLGSQLESTEVFSYGKYEATIKAAQASTWPQGVCGGFFWYDTNTQQEIDVEILSWEPEYVRYTVHSTNNEKQTQFKARVGNTQEETTYGFDWLPDKVVFRLDGEIAQDISGEFAIFEGDYVPDSEGKLMINHWTGDANYTSPEHAWSGEPPDEDRTMVISLVSYIPLFADLVPFELCMVLDRSGSMGGGMNGKTKLKGVKEAAGGIVNALLPNDRVSLVSFSSSARTDIDFTSDFDAVKTEINELRSGGMTSFGAGLKAALDEFDNYGNPEHIQAILFMSDGYHNTPPAPGPLVTECKNREIPIYTVGFAKTPSEVDEVRLKNMAAETNGEYRFANQIFDLQNIFLELQHKAAGWEVITTFQGEIPDEGQRVKAGDFYVDPEITDLRVTLNWPGSNLDLELYDPDGQFVDSSYPDARFSGDIKPEYVIIEDPKVGQWMVHVFAKETNSPEHYYVLVTKYVPPYLPVYFDIKPGSCPNPLNLKSKGVLPVAILGTDEFDVATIDPATIWLSKKGVEGEVAPLRWSHEDVATPFEGELCDCHDLNGDGYLDLTLKFKAQEVVNTLELDVNVDETIPLTLKGNLVAEEDGIPIQGQDCVRVQ